MKAYLTSILTDALKQFDLESLPNIQIEKPRQPEHGDAATNVAMSLAGTLKDNPRNIAETIVQNLDYDERRIASVEVAGPGFINFRYANDYLYDQLSGILKAPDTFGRTEQFSGEKVLVEFVSANPTGPLTIGHGRNAVLGDTVARLMEWNGARVEREYYFNDAGRQMRKLGESVRYRYLQELGHSLEMPEDAYQGEYIRDIARELVRQKGESLSGEQDLTPFTKAAETAIFEDIKHTLELMGIAMDSFFNEHDLYENGGIERTVKALRDKGYVYEEEGASWLKTTAFGKEKDTVIIKSSGEPTYRLPDIAYHADKLDRKFDRCIDVFGADHIDTYPDVVNAVEALGYDISPIDVLVYQFVTIVKEGKPFKMSTRKAQFVTLEELMEEVGSDVTRFFFLMRSPDTHLEFDIAEAKEASEKNPVFYLQYAHARIHSILRKARSNTSLEDHPDLTVLTEQAEVALIKKLLDLPEVVHSAAYHKQPHRLSNYLHELAGTFTDFYHECRIIGEEEQIMQARAALARATAHALANGLTILGISAPEQM